MAMDIPIDAEAVCSDGACGRSTYVILNPKTRQVTHLVVKEKGFPFTERLVSVDQVTETSPHRIRLRCSREEFAQLDHFIGHEYFPGTKPTHPYAPHEYMLWPFLIPEVPLLPPLEQERVPPGELAVRRNARVEASDGPLGHVEGFLLDTEGCVTHMVLRKGHFLGQKDIAIPISQIDRIEEDTVFLKLDKHGVEKLEPIPARREL